MAKEAEERLVHLVNGLNWYHHKYGDVRYCIHCHQPLPKSELAPDFAVAPIFYWIECKNNDSTGRWNWKSDIGPEGARSRQREWLKTNSGWLFIQLGKGRAPKGKAAWLIDFEAWEKVVEPRLIANNISSVRLEGQYTSMDKGYRPPAEEYLGTFTQLMWKDGGWIIPKGHKFWRRLEEDLQINLNRVRSML